MQKIMMLRSRNHSQRFCNRESWSKQSSRCSPAPWYVQLTLLLWQADVKAAAAKNDMLNKVHLQAKDIRATEQRTVEAKLDQAWKKKKIQLNLKVINCANPSADENPASDAQKALAKLEEKQTLEALKPKSRPPGDPINPELKNEIEENVKRTEKAAMKRSFQSTRSRSRRRWISSLTKRRNSWAKKRKKWKPPLTR